jgi:hypothetical protein
LGRLTLCHQGDLGAYNAIEHGYPSRNPRLGQHCDGTSLGFKRDGAALPSKANGCAGLKSGQTAMHRVGRGFPTSPIYEKVGEVDPRYARCVLSWRRFNRGKDFARIDSSMEPHHARI